MEGVLAAALGGGPRPGAGGAGGRPGPGPHGEAVRDAEAVEPADLRHAGRGVLSLALHGSVRLCPAAAREAGEAAVDPNRSEEVTACLVWTSEAGDEGERREITSSQGRHD